ncbi:hypothetical protein CVT24_009198 [Panaeolus cyanescens]|uniref:F-box domain-containing protein n=1 Tax=Panaeolus cyanescens TaxID=181874 RepID=A0A409Y8F6_9AGAR|nr:hypothetical protein CVT24_009198 [Panaeolus cyanescens]
MSNDSSIQPAQRIFNELSLTLQQSDIRLESLETNLISRHMIDYLHSYSGTLRSLKIVHPEELVQYRDVLRIVTKHASSLRHLELYHKDWTIIPPSIDALSQCKNLRTLSIGLMGAFYNGERLREGDLPQLMENASRLPHLKKILLEFVDLDNCHVVAPIHDAVRIFLRRFRSPISAAKPPDMIFQKYTYTSVADPSGTSWAYQGDDISEEDDYLRAPLDEDEWPDDVIVIRRCWELLGGDANTILIHTPSQET